jgi:hypothetical protein
VYCHSAVLVRIMLTLMDYFSPADGTGTVGMLLAGSVC